MTSKQRFDWATTIDAVCVLLRQSRESGSPPTLPAIDTLRRIAGEISTQDETEDEGWREHPDGRITVAEITLRPPVVETTCSGCERLKAELLAVQGQLLDETRDELRVGDEIEFVQDGDTGVIIGLDPDARVTVRWKSGTVSTPMLSKLRRAVKTSVTAEDGQK